MKIIYLGILKFEICPFENLIRSSFDTFDPDFLSTNNAGTSPRWSSSTPTTWLIKTSSWLSK